LFIFFKPELPQEPHRRGTEKKKNVFSKLLLLSKPKSVKQTKKDMFKQTKKNLETELADAKNVKKIMQESFYLQIMQ
jgi:hypothetical protein